MKEVAHVVVGGAGLAKRALKNWFWDVLGRCSSIFPWFKVFHAFPGVFHLFFRGFRVFVGFLVLSWFRFFLPGFPWRVQPSEAPRARSTASGLEGWVVEGGDISLFASLLCFPKGPKWLKHVKTPPKKVFWALRHCLSVCLFLFKPLLFVACLFLMFRACVSLFVCVFERIPLEDMEMAGKGQFVFCGFEKVWGGEGCLSSKKPLVLCWLAKGLTVLTSGLEKNPQTKPKGLTKGQLSTAVGRSVEKSRKQDLLIHPGGDKPPQLSPLPCAPPCSGDQRARPTCAICDAEVSP